MKRIIYLVLTYIKKFKYFFLKPKRFFLHKNISYFAQWESPNLVVKILSKEIPARNDPKWKNSGAKTREEYELWSWNLCGMTCLKMILAKKLNKEFPLVFLGKKCMEYGGYKISKTRENIDGLFYYPFLRFIKKEFNLSGKVLSPMILREIIYELSNGNFILASVSAKIRNPKDEPINKNGHLVLMLGYNLNKKILFFHNPSANTKESQSYAQISFLDFSKFFGGRGIAIKI